MSDLVERMRKEVVQDNFVGLLDEAAARIEALEAALITEWAARDNRIEALEAEVARLNSIIEKMLNAEAARIEALEAALRMVIDNVETGSYESTGEAIKIARAALAPEQDKP
jgi:hypothetical protein